MDTFLRLEPDGQYRAEFISKEKLLGVISEYSVREANGKVLQPSFVSPAGPTLTSKPQEDYLAAASDLNQIREYEKDANFCNSATLRRLQA